MASISSYVESHGDETVVRAHLARILESPQFAHAHQLQNLLTFLVEAVLAGRQEELKEYTLGREVFRRGDSYDPRTDAIVRVQVSILRKRLSAYYETVEPAAPLRIQIPRGSYVPEVCEGCPPMEEAAAEGSDASLPLPNAPTRLRVAALLIGDGRVLSVVAAVFVIGVLSGALLLMAAYRGDVRSAYSGDATLSKSFDARHVSPHLWGELLQGEQTLQLAFGCPQFFRAGGFYVRDVELNQVESSPQTLRLRDFNRALGTYLTPAPNTYTGVGEIVGVHAMTQFLSHHHHWVALENAQLLTPEQVRGKNLIVVSSYRFRTVLDLLELPEAILKQFGGADGFSLPNPQGNERALYQTRGAGAVAVSYGVVSYWRQPGTGGHVLLLSGIDSWSTEGVVRYVTSEEHLRDLESRLAGEPWDASKGIQILVEVEGQESRPTSMRYITHRLL